MEGVIRMSDIINPQKFITEEFSAIFLNKESSDDGTPKINPQYFIDNYASILFRYVANGKPSSDTKKSYISNIDAYLEWCSVVKMNPFNIGEQHLLYYRSMLVNQGLKPSTIKFKLTCIRRFYFVAQKYNLIKLNPGEDIHAPRDPDMYLPIIKYLTLKQLNTLINSFDETDEQQLRTKAIVLLMAVDGLRTVEVHRLNVSDINFNIGLVYIRGKGYNDLIYPSDATMKYLRAYINSRYAMNSPVTPVFTSSSNNSKGKRISRQSIRTDIDNALMKCGYKSQGNSCHMLRHTCGTLLYEETKDIQIVKLILRHRNIEMTSKYSHIQDALLKRYTNSIPIKIK